jgi:uncharacterized alkaline shock family protein YloU
MNAQQGLRWNTLSMRKERIMAETRTGDTTSTPSTGQRLQRGLAQADSSAVVVDQKATQGKTTIADGVVAKIVGIAAREIDGVHDVVGSGAGATISGLATRVTRGDTRSQGVSVEVGEREAAASITIIAMYGVSIPQVADAVRRNIIDRVEAMTGLTVIAVDIAVTDLYFPEDESDQQQTRVQ